MRQEIINQDILLDIDKRLVKKLWKVEKSDNFPDGLEFAYQYLYYKESKWIQVARIDNQLHEGKLGTHIHVLKKEVYWENLTFEEAEEQILKIGIRTLNNIIEKI